MGKFDEFWKKYTETKETYTKLCTTDRKNENLKNHITDIASSKFETLSFDDYTVLNNQKNQLNEVRSYIYRTAIAQVDDYFAYIEFMLNHPYKKLNQESFDDCYRFIHDEFTRLVKTENKEIKDFISGLSEKYKEGISKKSGEAYKGFVKDFLTEGKKINGFRDFIMENQVSISSKLYFTDMENKDMMEKFFQNMKEFGIDLEKFDVKEAGFDFDYRTTPEAHPYQEKIDELSKNSDDPGLKEALNKANSIIIHADNDITNAASDAAESFAENCDFKLYNLSRDYLLKNYPDKLDRFFYQNQRYQLKDYSKENIEDIRKNVEKKINPSLPIRFKGTFKIIYNKMIENGFYDPKTYSRETQAKIYSLNKLMADVEKTKDAIDSKNASDIKKCITQYKHDEALYDELIHDVMRIDNGNSIAGNVSSSRESSVPAKYRNDPIGVSRVTGIWQTAGMLDKYNIKIDEFLDDPFGVVEKKLHELIDNDDFNKDMKNENFGDMLNDYYKTSSRLTPESSDFLETFGRVIDPIIRMLPDENLKAEFTAKYNMLNATCYQLVQTKNNINSSIQVMEDSKEYMIDMLTVEPKDRTCQTIVNGYIDPFNGKTTKFDRKAYITKHQNIEGILLRAYNGRASLEEYSNSEWIDNAQDSITEIVDLVDQLATRKTPLVVDALKRLHKEKPLKNTMIENLKSINNFKQVTLGGLSDLNVTEAAKIYNNLKNQYDSRSGFAKFFFSNVRQQEGIIHSYEEAFEKAGYNKDTLRSIINGDIVIEKPVVKTDNDINKEQLDMSLDIEEKNNDKVEGFENEKDIRNSVENEKDADNSAIDAQDMNNN